MGTHRVNFARDILPEGFWAEWSVVAALPGNDLLVKKQPDTYCPSLYTESELFRQLQSHSQRAIRLDDGTGVRLTMENWRRAGAQFGSSASLTHPLAGIKSTLPVHLSELAREVDGLGQRNAERRGNGLANQKNAALPPSSAVASLLSGGSNAVEYEKDRLTQHCRELRLRTSVALTLLVQSDVPLSAARFVEPVAELLKSLRRAWRTVRFEERHFLTLNNQLAATVDSLPARAPDYFCWPQTVTNHYAPHDFPLYLADEADLMVTRNCYCTSSSLLRRLLEKDIKSTLEDLQETIATFKNEQLRPADDRVWADIEV